MGSPDIYLQSAKSHSCRMTSSEIHAGRSLPELKKVPALQCAKSHFCRMTSPGVLCAAMMDPEKGQACCGCLAARAAAGKKKRPASASEEKDEPVGNRVD
jgi:hypothetical protein